MRASPCELLGVDQMVGQARVAQAGAYGGHPRRRPAEVRLPFGDVGDEPSQRCRVVAMAVPDWQPGPVLRAAALEVNDPDAVAAAEVVQLGAENRLGARTDPVEQGDADPGRAEVV